ncbi:hypothetical protein C5688_11865 [Methylocystis sp. MitZ-2018]|jgi:uncharacterized protein YacL|nr:hypothetical protein C5688_11865 [Methylocystis sp. MitZ-2018]
MENIELTPMILLRVWWAYSWRAFFGAFAIGCVIGFIIAFVGLALGVDRSNWSVINLVINFPIGLIWSIFAFRMVLAKDFGDFKICLVKSAPSTEKLDVSASIAG